ncbi:hypothetical protein VE03_05841 [Pseudogymnoascus sp. 23342-1-I1]|nr:hypothetical protein VE03_05841 [Pseudogymnoascus sp. 23342-1-I1]
MVSRSLFTAGTAALSVLATVDATSYLKYSTVPGYFLQDIETTATDGFDYTATNFGLIDQSYDSDASFDPTGTKTQWERFENEVSVLNADSTADERYAVLYLGRHGEGYHNVAESSYGTPAWNCYWSELDGNGTFVWADAKVTPNGVAQAEKAHAFWISQIASQKQSIPESFYTSPLSRCLETAKITFESLVTPFKPLIKEYLREGISMHTCDRRSSKSYIAENYPGWPFEAGFTEKDELWTKTTAETQSAQDKRSKSALDSIFSSDPSSFLSITSHSGEIGSLLRVVGHRKFSLSTGAVIPVLVKVEKVEGTAPYTSVAPAEAQATCNAPPITSIADVGCVCSSTTSASVSASTSASASGSASASASASVTASASASVTTSASASVSASTSGGASNTTLLSTTSTVYATSVHTITKCPATVTNCPIGSVTTITYVDYTTVCPVGTVPTVTPEAPYPSANGTTIIPQKPSSANGTTIVPQNPSSSIVPSSQPSSIIPSSATSLLSSSIAMTAGFALFAFWM